MRRRETTEWFFEIGLDLERLSEELSPATPKVARGKHWEPRVDVLEEANHLLVMAEIAGVRGDDITLSYIPQTNSLILRGVRPHPVELESNAVAHHLEIFYGEFVREIKLPEVPIRPEAIRGSYRNGFLHVTIPKA